MTTPIDPGDIFGVAIWEALKRALTLFLVMWIGSGIGVMCVTGTEAINCLFSWDLTSLRELAGFAFRAVLLGPVTGFLSLWIVLYLPVSLGAIFMCSQIGESGRIQFFIIMFGYAIMSVCLYWSDMMGIRWLIFPLLAGSGVSLFYLLRVLGQFQQNRFAQHMAEIAAENASKRQSIKNRFGTAAVAKTEQEAPEL